MGKIITWVVLAFVFIIGAFAIFDRSGSANTIKIGAILPLTGDAVSYGESESRAIEIAVNEINENGGIAGKEIELLFEDGECDPQTAGRVAQKLVNIDGVRV